MASHPRFQLCERHPMATAQAKETPVVSVIVPVYNVEEYLVRCLDSLINQTTDAPYEIICVNDCSPDNSTAILEDYALCFPNLIRVLANAQNVGLGATRDHGIEEARGEYLMFIDSDDYVREDYIEQYLAAMENNPCDVIIGGYIDTDGSNEQVRFLPHSPWTELSFSAAWAKLYRRDFVAANGLKFTGIRYAEDTLFSLNAFACNAQCTIIDYAGYYYFANPSSITRDKRQDRKLEKALSALYGDFIASAAFLRLASEKRRMVEYSYIADMLSTILLFSKGCEKAEMKRKHDFFIADLQKKFPDYRENPHLGLFKPTGQRNKIRLGVGMFRWADRLGLSNMLFMLFASAG